MARAGSEREPEDEAKTKELRGKTFLVASIFAFFATASNDFAIGLPVIKALYGSEVAEQQYNMPGYIAGNAFISAAFFAVIATFMLAIGNKQKSAIPAQFEVITDAPMSEIRGIYAKKPDEKHANRPVYKLKPRLENAYNSKAVIYFCGRWKLSLDGAYDSWCYSVPVPVPLDDFTTGADTPAEREKRKILRENAQKIKRYNEFPPSDGWTRAAERGFITAIGPNGSPQSLRWDIAETLIVKEKSQSAIGLGLKTLWLSWVTRATLAGIIYHYVLFEFFGSALMQGSDGFTFPPIIGDVITLVTAGFGPVSLFIAGSTVVTAKFPPTKWAYLLAFMKVITCSVLTYGLMQKLTPSDTKFTDFGLFYGAIPTSCAPLVLANEYAPEMKPELSAGVMVSMVVAFGFMFVSAFFLQREQGEGLLGESAILSEVQVMINTFSFVIGVVFASVWAVARVYANGWSWPHITWCFGNASRSLLTAWLVVQITYQSLSIYINPSAHFSHDACAHWDDVTSSTTTVFYFTLMQNSSRILIVFLQVCAVVLEGCSSDRWKKLKEQCCGGIGIILMALAVALAVLPSMKIVPNTLNEMCNRQLGTTDLRTNLYWTIFLLVVTLSMATYDAVRPDSDWQRFRKISKDNFLPRRQKDDYSPIVSKAARLMMWAQIVIYVIQVVNTLSALKHAPINGAFAASLALESLAQYGFLTAVVFAICVDKDFRTIVFTPMLAGTAKSYNAGIDGTVSFAGDLSM